MSNRLKRTLFIVAIFFILSVFFIYEGLPGNSKEFEPVPEKLFQEQLKPSAYLLILIMCSPNDTQSRQVIRDTWFKLNKKPAAIASRFVIGTSQISPKLLHLLHTENEGFKDMIFLEELKESYHNLTRKTLQTFVKAYETWDFKFVMKVDSDSFVRPIALLNALKTNAHPRLYWGFLDGRARPMVKGKWTEPGWMLCDRYLPYQLGGGYVIAYDLVEYIAKNSRLLKLYKNEDVSVGAWLAGLNVHYVHDPRFDTEWTSRGCNDEYLVTHKHDAPTMKHFYRTMERTGKLCTHQIQERPSYIYDFSVPPSQCCVRTNRSKIP